MAAFPALPPPGTKPGDMEPFDRRATTGGGSTTSSSSLSSELEDEELEDADSFFYFPESDSSLLVSELC